MPLKQSKMQHGGLSDQASLDQRPRMTFVVNVALAYQVRKDEKYVNNKHYDPIGVSLIPTGLLTRSTPALLFCSDRHL